MVIAFKSECARNQLLEHGVVYTVRLKKRSQTGKDWANIGRGTEKIADVWIEYFGLKKFLELRHYVDESGFRNLPVWWSEIAKLNKEVKISDLFHLYKVSVRGWVND